MSEWWIDSSDLDEDQRKVVALAAKGNYLVSGPPGSGKTNLLLLRATYLSRQGLSNLMVLTFTRQLRDFISRGRDTYGLPDEQIQTVATWQLSLLREQGKNPTFSGTFEEQRAQRAEAVWQLFEQNNELERHLDCILVDEIQDCTAREVEIFLRAAEYVFFVGDDRQQIYALGSKLTDLEASGGIIHQHLRYHYRNGTAICKVADKLAKQVGSPQCIDSCNYDESTARSSAELYQFANEAELFGALISNIELQLRAYPDELIGIMVPKKEHLDGIRQRLEGSVLSTVLMGEHRGNDDENDGRRVVLCTMHSAKGLEFRTAHLPYVEYVKSFGATQKRLAYTAVTRAKTSLTAYALSSPPGYIQSAFTAAKDEPPSIPPVADLFRKNGR